MDGENHILGFRPVLPTLPLGSNMDWFFSPLVRSWAICTCSTEYVG